MSLNYVYVCCLLACPQSSLCLLLLHSLDCEVLLDGFLIQAAVTAVAGVRGRLRYQY